MKKSALLYLIILGLLTTKTFAQKPVPVLEHIAVYVQDLNKSTWFYQHIIQLDTVPEPFHDGRHTWFTVGNGSFLHIIQGASGITSHDKNTHLCFRVPSVG